MYNKSNTKRIALFLLIISMMLVNNYVLAEAQQQTITITGVVSDQNEPLPGVSVTVIGTSIGSISDGSGRYTINVPNESSVLSFSFVGYTTYEITVGNQRIINVVLEEGSQMIDELIVVAYGTVLKSTFTGSATTIGSEKLERISGTGFAETMQGLSAGVNIVSAHGNPGADARVEIRGVSSMSGSSSPLYIVDGMPFDGRLNQINPADIESMTVLKDAAATSLYGSRAANGVIVINTKRGQAGKPRINVRTAWGTSDNAVRNPVKADPYQQLENMWYASYYDRFYRNNESAQVAGDYASARTVRDQLISFTNSAGQPTYISPFRHINEDYVLHDGNGNPYKNPNLQYVWEESDWDVYKAVFSRKLRQDYNVDVSGQSENGKTSYFFSGGYMDDLGYGNRQYYKRYSFRTNVTTEVKDWWKIGASLAYSRHRQNLSSGNSRALNFTTTLSSPWLRNVDNTEWVVSEKTGNRMFAWGTYTSNFFGIHIFSNSGDYWDNPDDHNFDNNMGHTLTSQVFNEFKLPFNLTFRTALNLNDNWHRTMQYGSAVHGSGQMAPYGVTVTTAGGNAWRYNYNRLAATWNNVLSGVWSVDNHNIAAMAGHELYTWNSHWEQAGGYGIMEIGKYEVSNTTRDWGASGSRDNYALLSFFGKVDYNFSNKYYLSASVREDGSSRFHPNNRWGTFWSVGGSWRITEENFMGDIAWLNNLSLRGSYGTTGNDRLIPRTASHGVGGEILYAYQGTYSGNNLYMVPGLKPASHATPDLQWESNNQWNVGIDFSLFRRLGGTLEYYSRTSQGLLFYKDLPISAQAGTAAGYNMNIGDLKNSGLELTINANVYATRDFRWDVDFNMSTVKNEVTYLASEPYTYAPRMAEYKMEEGKSIFEFIAAQYDGINPDNGSPGWLIRDGANGWKRTEVATEVTSDDQVYVGSAIPKGFGSITNNFIYKGLDFSFMLYFQYGSKIFDYTWRERIQSRPGCGMVTELIEDRWMKPGDVTEHPRWSWDDFGTMWRYSDQFVLPNHYMRLRNLTLGYSLPKNVSQRAGIDNLRLYVTGNNLLTFGPAAKRLTDPETGIQGNNYNGNNDTDTGYQGSRRIFMFGIQMTL